MCNTIGLIYKSQARDCIRSARMCVAYTNKRACFISTPSTLVYRKWRVKLNEFKRPFYFSPFNCLQSFFKCRVDVHSNLLFEINQCAVQADVLSVWLVRVTHPSGSIVHVNLLDIYAGRPAHTYSAYVALMCVQLRCLSNPSLKNKCVAQATYQEQEQGQEQKRSVRI